MPHHIKILVVDDDPDILFSSSRFLEQAGLQVFLAGTGQEALALAFREQPALVLLDSDLPDIDGQGICRQIKENPLCRSTLVLMISANRATTEDRTNAPDDGADGYLARPISNRELLSHIEVMLRIREHEIGLTTKTQELEEAIRIRKVTEAALEQRLVALTQPLDSTDGLQFEDLFNLEEIQKIQDAFATATGVASIITDTEGRPITKPSNFCHLCANIIRKTEKGLANCYCSDAVLGRINRLGSVMQPCLSGGLWDGGASICAGDRHLANWVIGQVLDDSADMDKMIAYAHEIGVDEQAFREGLKSVKRMPKKRFQEICEALFLIAGQLSRQARHNIQQARYISDRKRAEEALRQSQEEALTRAQELSALLNAVPAAVWIAHDPQALCISGNRQSYECLGLPEGANVSKSSPEGEKPETFRLFKNGLELRTQEMPVQRSAAGEQLRDYEFDLVYPSGASRHMLGNATPLFDEQGKPRGSVSVFIDITERKQMEEKLLRSQRMESIGALAGGVAHDLNNILAPIMMSASLLHEELAPKMRKDLITSIETAAHRGAHIVNQVLTFAKGIKGIRTLVDPEITLLEMEKIAWETFPKSISVSVTMPEGLWNAIGDPTQLHQVLLNLCINARDAMPQGGTLLLSAENIEISRLQASQQPDAKPGRYIKFKIKDSGRGISPHHINKVFDPFFTTKGPGVGPGLGLSMVAGIVRSHGGFIIVNSEVDKGTTFEVFIPASKEAAQASESPTASAPTSGKGELILVVDDEPEVLKLTKAILEQFGYSVLTAKDGREAVTLYSEQSSRIQLVITDLMMPKIDGAGVARVIRQSDQNLPIIVASGFGSDEIQSDLSTLGIQTFLKKPFNATHLLQTIHETIHKKES